MEAKKRRGKASVVEKERKLRNQKTSALVLEFL
jgi:hypothetical protein